MARNSTHGRRSLVLVTVDCLRADHCGFYGYSRPTTPFLNSLASESIVVPAAIVAGVTLNLESEFEAVRAGALATALGKVVKVAVRVNPAFELKGAGLRMGGKAQPFGIDEAAVPALLIMMSRAPNACPPELKLSHSKAAGRNKRGIALSVVRTCCKLGPW